MGIIHIKSGTLEIYPDTAGQNPSDMLAAFGTNLDRLITHLLKNLKIISTVIT